MISDNFSFQNNGIKKGAHVGKQWFFWKTMGFWGKMFF